MIIADKVVGKDGKFWIKASFKPTFMLLEAIKRVPGSIYHNIQNVWGVPYTNRESFEDIMGDFLIYWVNEEVSNNGGIPESSIPSDPIVEGYTVEYGENREILSSTGFKTSPWGEFQVKGFNLMVDRNFLILADDAGLGKTWQVANAIEAKKKLGQVHRGVVVVKASLLYNWRDEIHMHTNQKAVVMTGTPLNRCKLYSKLQQSDDWTFLIMSYETFRVDVKNLQLIDNFKPLDFCVVDEAHKIKNSESKIGSCIHNLPFMCKYVLTATPLPNTPLESFNYLKFGKIVDINWWEFQGKYAEFGSGGQREIIGYKNIKELKSLIQENMLRRRKGDKLKELPDITKKVIRLEMTKQQNKLYNAVKKGILEDLKDTTLEKVPNALAKLIRLQQITDTTALIEEDKNGGHSVKFEALDDLLEDLIDNSNEKVIVFSRFKEVALMLNERYSRYNPALIHGDVDAVGMPMGVAENRLRKFHGDKWLTMSQTDKNAQLDQLTTSERQRQVYKFQGEEDCKLFLGSTTACREGLTLTKATHVIFIDSEWSPAYVEQAYSRAHRIGQRNNVTVYFLVCEGTIDEHVQATLKRKESMAQVMLDEGIDSVGVTVAREMIASMIGEKLEKVG